MSISEKTAKKILSGAFLWSGLGFYRGIQHNDYTYKQDTANYNKKMIEYHRDMKKHIIDTQKYPDIYIHSPRQPLQPYKYYTDTLVYGIWGSLLYLSPYPGIFFAAKEIYILEINLRNLEDEKKTKYYNTLDIIYSKRL